MDAVERLAQFAAARGRSLLELAISWLVAQPAVASVIPGATSAEQVKANAAAAAWRLTADDLAAVNAIVPPVS
jgi:aryl-alcohol dehydrogenase-like predicted oxidoreductase